MTIPVALLCCDTHRDQLAGWRCRACGGALCPACAYDHAVGPATVVACTRCRGLTDPITVRRALRHPFLSTLPDALIFPVAQGGWMTLLGAAVVFWGLSKLGFLGALFAFGLQWGLVFSVIKRTSHEPDPLLPPGFDGLLEDIFLPALRAVLGFAIIWVPAALWIGATTERAADLLGGAWLTDPVLWLLLLVGVAWAPAALTAAAVCDSTLSILDPRVPLSLARRLGGDYALLLGVALVAAVGHVLLGLLGALVAAQPVPIVAGVAARALGLWAPLVFARAAGLLLWTCGDALDYGPPGDYQVPVLAGVAPRGKAPPTLAPAAIDHAPEPIELPIERTGHAAEPADLRAEPAPPPPPFVPDPRALFEEARAAAAAGRYDEAASLLREAAADEAHPVAPTAWLVLGRLYRNRMGHPEAGRQALEYLVARWPDAEPARQARALLAAP